MELFCICDPHWTLKKPFSRTDDFLEVQKRKLDHLRGVIKDSPHPSSLLIAGDLFHQPKAHLIERTLDTLLLDLLPKVSNGLPILTIPGNHDLSFDRVSSLDSHPYGVLRESGVITCIDGKPPYRLEDEESVCFVVGERYHSAGPLMWLNNLRANQTLITLKKQVAEETGKAVYVSAMTHCFWGPKTGKQFSEVSVGYDELRDTGIDVMVVGHPHRDNGVVDLGYCKISEPGALHRGSLNEMNTERKPQFCKITCTASGVEVENVVIPHEPAKDVFNMNARKRAKDTEDTTQKLIGELSRVSSKSEKPIEELLKEFSSNVSTLVRSKIQHYLLEAEGEVK